MTKISVGGGGGPQPRKPKVRHPQTKVAKGTNDLGRALGKALGAPQRATTGAPPPRLVDPVVRPNKAGVLHNPKGSGNLVRSQTSINRGRANSKHLPRAVRREAQRQVSEHDKQALLRGISTVAAASAPLAHVKAPDKIDSIVSSVLGGHHRDPITDLAGAVGIHTPSIGDVGRGILERSIYNPIRATIEHPGDVLGSTAKSIPNIATGSAGAVAELLTHPKQFIKQVPKQTVADLNRRYKGSLSAQRERMRHEGALPEAIDAITALSPTGVAGGRILNRTAASGALGDTAKAIATVRPKLRIHPGVHGAVEQELSPNFIRNVGRHVADNSRARAAVKRAKRAEQGHPISDLVPGEGEVVKRFKRTQDAALRKGVNARQARGHARMMRTTARETRAGSQRDMYLKLNRHERQAVGEIMSLGLTPQTAERELRARLEQIHAHRESKPVRLTGHDEVPVIESILAAPEKHLTPRAFQIADEQIARAKRTAAMDPQLKRNPDVALARQYADQAAHLGVERGGTPIEGVIAGSKMQLKEVKKNLRAGERSAPRLERAAGRQQGRAELQVERSDRATAERIRRAENGVRIAERAAVNHARRGDAGLAEAARARAAAGRIRVEHLKGELDRRPVRAVAASGKREADVLHGRVVTGAARRKAKALEKGIKHLESQRKKGIDYLDRESAQHFIARVQKAAAERGLKEPGYLFAGDTGTRGSFAAGRFGRAVAPNRQNRGIRFRAGTRDVGPEAVVLGPQRNIKRAVSWETANDIIEHNAPEWGKDKTVSQLNHAIHAHKLDPSAWRFVDIGQVRDAMDASAQDHLPGGLQDAVGASTFTLDGIPAHFKSSGRRLTAIPKVAADELHVAAGPLHSLNRGWAKVQGAVSRTIIHTNPTFVPVQVVSNTPLSLLAMKGDVRHFVRGSKLMKGIDAKARDFAEDYMGISASEGMAKAPRMGDTSTRLGGALSFFDSPQVRTWLDRKNPMHWNPILDEKQNNWFRRAVFHSYASKQRAVVISDAMRAIVGDAPKLTDLLKMPDGPERDAAFRANEHLFEKVGNKAAEMLGEYGRYSARERALLKTNVLFYGFLRWSVQFAFYTLPIKHPIAAAITAKLGQLHDEEVVDLLSSAGAAKGMGSKRAIADLLRQGAMPYVFGRVWITKKGQLESVDLTRVNPMLNPLMDALGSGPVGGAAKVISPALSPLLDIAYGKDQFTGQDLTNAGGQKINFASPLAEQVRVVGGDIGRLAFPLRVSDKLLHPQEQASDSVPIIAPSNKKASGPTDLARQAAKRQERGTNSEVLKDNLLPLVTSKRDGTLRGIAGQMQKKGKVKKSKGGGGFFGGSSNASGSFFGGSSGGSSSGGGSFFGG